jgi:hypothetical protein
LPLYQNFITFGCVMQPDESRTMRALPESASRREAGAACGLKRPQPRPWQEQHGIEFVTLGMLRYPIDYVDRLTNVEQRTITAEEIDSRPLKLVGKTTKADDLAQTNRHISEAFNGRRRNNDPNPVGKFWTGDIFYKIRGVPFPKLLHSKKRDRRQLESEEQTGHRRG